MNIRDATSLAVTLGAGATSEVFSCIEGGFNVLVSGLMETSTLRLQASHENKAASFNDLLVYSSAGTPTPVDFAVAEVPDADSVFMHWVHGEATFFRFKTNSVGVAPAIRVDITGHGVNRVDAK